VRGLGRIGRKEKFGEIVAVTDREHAVELVRELVIRRKERRVWKG
jgi:uncharacterized protein YabE (DUF348 family)